MARKISELPISAGLIPVEVINLCVEVDRSFYRIPIDHHRYKNEELAVNRIKELISNGNQVIIIGIDDKY